MTRHVQKTTKTIADSPMTQMRLTPFHYVGLIAVAVLIGGQLSRWWTRPAAVEFDNLKYIQMLTTAVSTRNLEWVNKVDLAIQKRLAAQQMSSKEHQHFQKIITMARNSEWEKGDRACFEFAQAQLNRKRARAAPPLEIHKHEHPHSH